MERLGDGSNYYTDAQELPDEAAFMRKLFERGEFKISVDLKKLEQYINDNINDVDLRTEMLASLQFILIEMDPALKTQALVRFFQKYYAQLSTDPNLQRIIDFVLLYEAAEAFALLFASHI